MPIAEHRQRACGADGSGCVTRIVIAVVIHRVVDRTDALERHLFDGRQCSFEKLRVGLQQLMAGARRFNAGCLSRDDLCCLTEEAAKISGIPYVMDSYRSQAMEIMNGNGRA